MIYLPGHYSYGYENLEPTRFVIQSVDYSTPYGSAKWQFRYEDTEPFSGYCEAWIHTMDRWNREEGWRYDPDSWGIRTNHDLPTR
jgi:hypothetical protein